MTTPGAILFTALGSLLLIACTFPGDPRQVKTGPQTGQVTPAGGPAGTVFQGLARGYRPNQGVWIGLVRTDDPQRRDRPLVWADLVYADSSGAVRFELPLPDFVLPGTYAATVLPEDRSAPELRLPLTFERPSSAARPGRAPSDASNADYPAEPGRALRVGDGVVPASGPAGTSFVITAGDFLPGERTRVQLVGLWPSRSGPLWTYPLGAPQADVHGVVQFVVPAGLDDLPDGRYAALVASIRDPGRLVRLHFSVGTGGHEVGRSGKPPANDAALPSAAASQGPASGPARLVVGTAATGGALVLDLVHGQGIESYRGVLSVDGTTSDGETVARKRVGVMGFTTESLPYGRYTIAYEAAYARVATDGERRAVHIPRQETTVTLDPDTEEARWEPVIR
jgi:hypothetical protein